MANLKINGDIKPPTCTVNGGDQADLVYNLGAVSPSVIPQTSAYNGLPKQYNTLTVECDSPTYLTFKATDNNQNPFIQTSGMNVNFKTFAFNMVDTASPDKTVGGIMYKWQKTTADGHAVYISRANDGTDDNGTWNGDDRLAKNSTNGWTKTQQKYVASSELDLVSAKIFSAEFYNSNMEYSGASSTYLLLRKN